MSIHIICNEKSFNCSYANWNIFRIEIIYSTIEYLQTLPTVSLEFNTSVPSSTPLRLQEKDYYNEIIIDFVKNIQKIKKHLLIEKIVSLCTESSFLIDTLIHYDVGGLFSLCNKNECVGYYSLGNSYDIYELFSKIKPFIINNNIIDIEKIFIESINTKKKVIIT